MKKLILLITIAIFMGSCSKDSLDPTVAQNKDVETGISTVGDLQGALCGAYNRMTASNYWGRNVIVYGEARSDNMYANGNSGRFITTASMYMTSADADADGTWNQIYATIASANVVISKEAETLLGDAAEKNNIIGQAYALRALAHYDALRIFGQQHVTGGTLGVPYVKQFKGTNALPARSTIAECKTFIYEDLDKALTLLSSSLNDPDKQFISTYAVDAIRARVAIYFGDWAIAKTACETIINSGLYSIIPQASFVSSWTIKHPVNSIFELAFNATDQLGNTGIQFIYRGTAYGDIRVLDDVQTIFDAGDVRNSAAMIGPDPTSPANLTCLGKYPAANYSDNIFLFRYEEVILNLAEALWRISPTDPNALTSLNSITAQRGALAYAAVTEANILKERRREFMFEGFRFDDLARTHTQIPIVDAIKQSLDNRGVLPYGNYRYSFPIPLNEMLANPNMVQNIEYL